jgi:hypothetical protein
VLTPLTLDPLTVADDPEWLDLIQAQPNLRPFISAALGGLYPG